MYEGIPCSIDSDCGSFLGICDMIHNVCSLPSLSVVEDAFLNCYISRMSTSTEYYIRHNVLTDPLSNISKNSKEFFDAVRLAASQPDCVNSLSPLDLTKRSKYVWEGSSIECMAGALNLSNTTNATEEVMNLCPSRYCLGIYSTCIFLFLF